MLEIDKKIISLDILEKKFVCDIRYCKGWCCIDGDSGAPLEEKEVAILKKIYPKVKPFMRKEGIAEVEKVGTSIIDSDGDKVTPLIDNLECVYVYFDKSVAMCAIEKAYLKKKIKYRKPVSCHLYPVRIKEYEKFDAVNYHRNAICKTAIENGKNLDVPLYKFLEEPLSRKYGKRWYKKLKYAGDNLKIIKTQT
jgi:hypothetical protein